jgi:hypothetical protein
MVKVFCFLYSLKKSVFLFVRREAMKKRIKLFANIKTEENWLALSEKDGQSRRLKRRYELSKPEVVMECGTVVERIC